MTDAKYPHEYIPWWTKWVALIVIGVVMFSSHVINHPVSITSVDRCTTIPIHNLFTSGLILVYLGMFGIGYNSLSISLRERICPHCGRKL